MFAEYRLKQEAHTKALVDAIMQSSSLVISPIAAWVFLFLVEPETLARNKMAIYIFMAVMFVCAILVAVNIFQKLISFRMISTDTVLEIQTLSNKFTLSYSEITKVEITNERVLLIYTESSSRTPVVAISDSITDREMLEAILKQFVPFTERTKLPFIYNKYVKHSITYVFLTSMFIHVMSRSGNTVIASGIVTIAVCFWTFAIQFKFRKEIPVAKTVIIYGVIVLIVCFRIWLMLYPQLYR